MWFDSWAGIARVLMVGTVSYAAVVILLPISGKRTLGQLNAFDLLVTVASGSTLATILLSSDIAFFEGLAALALLAGIAAVVLETNGTISVIPKNKLGTGSALKGVRGNVQA